jgi:hypothetical protein
LVVTWSLPDVRYWLLVALASHAAMRIWSLIDFVPKALAFERAEPASIDAGTGLDAAKSSALATRPCYLLRHALRLRSCGADVVSG